MEIKIPNKVNKKIAKKIHRNYSLQMNLKKIFPKFDLLICNSGFETRTLGAIQASKKFLQVKNSIIFIFHPKEAKLYVKNLHNLGKLKELISSISDETSIKELDPTNPWGFRHEMNEICKLYGINKRKKVLVDITSFTRVFLYELVYRLYKTQCTFYLFYTEPKEYTKVLPTGINKIIVSPSFVGKPRPNKKAFLLMFFGWEKGRSKDIFENYNADDHLGVFGVSPIDRKHIIWQQESKKRNEELMNRMRSIELCPTLDLNEIIKFLTKVYNKKTKEFLNQKERYYFTITGLGPKIQNLASSIFALKHKDVQLVYGTPAYWGSSKPISKDEQVESTGIGETYLYGPLSKKMIGEMRF